MNKITNPDVNYGKALSDLYDHLILAEKKRLENPSDPYQYPRAYGHLQGAIKSILVTTDVCEYDEINKALTGFKNEADDIPKNTFSTDLKETD